VTTGSGVIQRSSAETGTQLVSGNELRPRLSAPSVRRRMSTLVILAERPRIDTLLEPYRETIGRDFPGYRNHVHRAVTYAMHFLDQAPEFQQLVETAFVYHDIGLWTNRALAYLEPSEKVALDDNRRHSWGLDPEALRGAIHWHHKVFRYRGPHQQVIEACRKADWIDASQGWIRKGIRRSDIARVEQAFPNLGFHQSLLRLARDYGGSTLVGGWRVMRGIVKW
jgi:hypothetical protein